MKLLYMCRTGFKNGGGVLRERPSQKMGGFQSAHSRKKQGILKWVSFGAAHVEKVESLGAAKAEKVGVWGGGGWCFRAAHTRTVRIWDPPSPPPGFLPTTQHEHSQ